MIQPANSANINTNVTYDESDNTVILSTIVDGIADSLLYSIETGYGMDNWDDIVFTEQGLSIDTLEYFESIGYDVNVIIDLLNDESPDKVLLKILNGRVIYDVTGRH